MARPPTPSFEEMPKMLQELIGKVESLINMMSANLVNNPQYPNYMDKETTLKWLAEQGHPMSLSKLYKLTGRGEIPCTKPSGKLIFNQQQLRLWLTKEH